VTDKTKFKDLLLIKNKRYLDKRGYFKEIIKENNLKKKISFFSYVLFKEKRY
tara:strand:- start:2190 stop:2345 length:156 start_codon:yes stop_codon:yes gene_type:complete